MSRIVLFVVGFGRPDLLREQHRLFTKYLQDPFDLIVIDNSLGRDWQLMQAASRDLEIDYHKITTVKNLHNDALNFAAEYANDSGFDYWMTLDHDIFPRRETTLINKIAQVGFYGIGQWHTPTKRRYIWPGFAGFSREWLKGRIPNFDGIRGVDKRDDGDCGSMLNSLFTEEEWARLPRTDHGYRVIRPEDEYGLQSYGLEFFDDFIHLTNASHWMTIRDPEERDRICAEVIAAL